MNHTDTNVNEIISKIKCFALDMDGTIYLGTKWIDGAKEFLKAIEDSGRSYVFLTNNSSKNPDVYVEKLASMGLPVTKEKIITSGDATIFYIKENYPGKKIFLLGNDMLKEQFIQEGICLTEDTPDLVVTAFDTSLDYRKMCLVCDYVRAGIPYISTHPDYNCPTEDGFIPDAGAIHAFIHASAFRYPNKIIGKPNAEIVNYLLHRVGFEKDQIIMIGDRLYTDVAAGANNGLHSALVLSGEATMEDYYASDVKPELIFDSVKDLIPYLS